MKNVGLETRLLMFTAFMTLLGGAIGYATQCQSEACLLNPNTGVIATGQGAAAGAGAAIGASLPALFSNSPEIKSKKKLK